MNEIYMLTGKVVVIGTLFGVSVFGSILFALMAWNWWEHRD